MKFTDSVLGVLLWLVLIYVLWRLDLITSWAQQVLCIMIDTEDEDEFSGNDWCIEHGKPAVYMVDPFRAEIYNVEVMMWLCEDCEYERLMDI